MDWNCMDKMKTWQGYKKREEIKNLWQNRRENDTLIKKEEKWRRVGWSHTNNVGAGLLENEKMVWPEHLLRATEV